MEATDTGRGVHQGKQYLATTSGGGSMTFGRDGSPTIVVFSLRGPQSP